MSLLVRIGSVVSIITNYKDKYLAEATLRYDGSMNFAKGHRWGLFPSFSAGWVMSEEGWFKPLTKAINFLKVKASYGVMGNDNIAAYQYLSTFSYRASDKICMHLVPLLLWCRVYMHPL